MQVKRSAPARGVRQLLLAALLLGIVTMHTLGHPAQHDPSHSSHASSDRSLAAAPHEPARLMAAQDVAADVAGTLRYNTPRAADPGPSSSTDPMSVCLAVLGSWIFVLLVIGHLPYRPSDHLAAVHARLLRTLRPMPPPGRRTPLSQLSVLRI